MGAMDEPPELAEVEDRVIPGPAGDLPVRIYTPDAPAPRPVIVVFFHGGGFVICSVDTHDGLARRLANATGAVVVSVEYRLAPEVRCPASAEDCYAAHAVDARTRGRAGRRPGSAGRGRRQRGWQPRRRRRADGERAERAADHRPGARVPGHRRRLRRRRRTRRTARATSSTATGMRWFWDHYLGPDGDDPTTMRHRSARDDLSGLPAAVVITAEYDPLRDEGEAYADALARPACRGGAALRRHDPRLREHADALSRSGRRGGARSPTRSARRWVDHDPARAGNRPDYRCVEGGRPYRVTRRSTSRRTRTPCPSARARAAQW